MKAQMCRFKRTLEGKWENGIMIGTKQTETMLLVDEKGEPITQDILFDFRLEPSLGCFESGVANNASQN